MVRQFAYVHGVAGISLLLGKNTIVHKKTLSRNPNLNYILALSHKKNKNRSWLPLFSLFSLMRLLTRLIGIFSLYILTAALLLKHNIYIYIYICQKSAGVKSPITNRIWSIGGRGLVAIHATHDPLQQLSCEINHIQSWGCRVTLRIKSH